jgi:hypothetical protein
MAGFIVKAWMKDGRKTERTYETRKKAIEIFGRLKRDPNVSQATLLEEIDWYFASRVKAQ